jgi:hypothetical protein
MFLRELYAEFAEKTDCPCCPRSARLPSAERPGGQARMKDTPLANFIK